MLPRFFLQLQHENIELAVQFYLTLNSVFRMVNLPPHPPLPLKGGGLGRG
jgi:hypothetical protein